MAIGNAQRREGLGRAATIIDDSPATQFGSGEYKLQATNGMRNEEGFHRGRYLSSIGLGIGLLFGDRARTVRTFKLWNAEIPHYR